MTICWSYYTKANCMIIAVIYSSCYDYKFEVGLFIRNLQRWNFVWMKILFNKMQNLSLQKCYYICKNMKLKTYMPVIQNIALYVWKIYYDFHIYKRKLKTCYIKCEWRLIWFIITEISLTKNLGNLFYLTGFLKPQNLYDYDKVFL